MANHDFQDPTEKAIENRRSYAKELTQQSGSLVSQLTAFKGKFDTLYANSTPEQQAHLDVVFQAFKQDTKVALGL